MVKSIIKRIIVGVGIALCLMAIKERGLIGQVHALSCSVSNTSYAHVTEDVRSNVVNTSRENSMVISYFDKNTFTNGDQRIYFNENDSYIDILVYASWTMAFQQNPVYNENLKENYQFHLQSSPPLFYFVFVDPNNGSLPWRQGVWDKGYFRVRFFKSEFPNNYVDLRQLKFGIPTWWYNFITSAFISFNGWVNVDHYHCDSNKALKEAIDENTKAIEKTNDTLKDSTTDNPSSDISSMNGKLASNGSITQLLTLPIQMYQNILNSASGSCSPFSLGSLYNHDLTLPCINLKNFLGSTLYGIIDILISGLFILSFRKKMVDIFNHMTSLNDRGNELE